MFSSLKKYPVLLLTLPLLFIFGLLFSIVPQFIQSRQLAVPIFSTDQNINSLDGFYPVEHNAEGSFRWSKAQAKITLPYTLSVGKISMEVAASYPPSADKPTLKLMYRGKQIAAWEDQPGWSTVNANLAPGLELASVPLELEVVNPLPPRKDDPRLLGVAVRSVNLEVRRVPPLEKVLIYLLLTDLVFGVAYWLEFSLPACWLLGLVPALLLTIYWSSNPYLGQFITGWLTLALTLAALVAFKPERLQSAAPKKIARLTQWILPGVIVALAFLCYREVTGYGFFNDDYHFARPWSVSEVLGTYAGTWDNWGLEQVYLRPIPITSYALNWLWSGYEPPGYHVINILLHGLNSALLYVWLKKSGLPWFGAATAALFFLIVPTSADTATWVSQRADALAVLFILLSLLSLQAYWRSFQRRWLVALNVTLVLAFLSKEISLVTPALLLLYSLLFAKDLIPDGKAKPVISIKTGLLVTGIPFGLAAIYLVYRSLVVPVQGIPSSLEIIVRNYFTTLAYTYTILDKALSQLSRWWFLVVLPILVLGLLARASFLYRLMLLAVCWLLLTCLPLSNIGINETNSRLLYLAEIGYSILVGTLIGFLLSASRNIKLKGSFWPALALSVLLIVAPYQPLEIARQKSQAEYAPFSIKTLSRDEGIYTNEKWKANLLPYYYNLIENKLRQAGRLKNN